MKDVIILIPPSEGKAEGGGFAPLKKVSAEVNPIVDQLAQVKPAQWPKLLGVKGKALEKAISSNQNILTAKTLPAIERYSGVVFSGIDYLSLNEKAQQFFDKHVRIVSAVFGLVRPQEHIPDYKLKIDKLKCDKYWQPINAKKLQGKFVIDLLPQAHKKAVNFSEGMSIEFVFENKGKFKPAGHQGKLIKGKFVRFLAEQGKVNESIIRKFKADGFAWQDGKFIKNQ